jgi:hypothetical protein
MRLVVLTLLALAACSGAKGQGPADGGPPDARAPGTRAFDVTAALAPAGPGASTQLPKVSTFTLVLDGDANRIIVGAMGTGTVVPVTATGPNKLMTTKPFSVNSAAPGACSGPSSVTFTSLQVTVSGASLSGAASGMATISCGDCAFQQPFTAVVSGMADVAAPFLVAAGVGGFDPFAQLTFVTSEPLPVTAKASLVAVGGGRVELEPNVEPGDVPVVTSFSKPDVILAFGEQYTVALDGLVDFAGHPGQADAPLRLGDTPAPPLAAQDGFESVTGKTFGNASVLSEPTVVIAGTRSLYLGGASAPSLGGVAAGGSLAVRLAVQPTDTKIVFSARGVAMNSEVGFAGLVNVGSVGHKTPVSAGFIGPFTNVPPTPVTVPGGTNSVFMSAPQPVELTLPPDHSDEVIVAIMPTKITCGPSFQVNGLIVDDLRAE